MLVSVRIYISSMYICGSSSLMYYIDYQCFKGKQKFLNILQSLIFVITDAVVPPLSSHFLDLIDDSSRSSTKSKSRDFIYRLRLRCAHCRLYLTSRLFYYREYLRKNQLSALFPFRLLITYYLLHVDNFLHLLSQNLEIV